MVLEHYNIPSTNLWMEYIYYETYIYSWCRIIQKLKNILRFTNISIVHELCKSWKMLAWTWQLLLGGFVTFLRWPVNTKAKCIKVKYNDITLCLSTRADPHPLLTLFKGKRFKLYKSRDFSVFEKVMFWFAINYTK